MPTTVKDIAKRAGVSHSTVSRALQGSTLISDRTAARIRTVAADMGYYPSAAARALKTHRSRVLGVVLSSVDDPFFSEILQGIEDTVQRSGYSLFIAAAHRDPQREREIVQTMVEHRADGVIICSTSFSEDQSRHLLEYGVPLVVVNNQAAEVFRYSIYHDDVDGSRQMTRHLLELGHTRVAYVGNPLSGRTNGDRLQGFREEMKAAGLSVAQDNIFEASGGGPGDAAIVISQILARHPLPTALQCYNDMLAIGVLAGLQHAGLRVPDDISVAGFDNIVYSGYTNPPLTTLDQPKRFIGAEAARLVLSLLESSSAQAEAEPATVQILRGTLLVRSSTAPPSGRM